MAKKVLPMDGEYLVLVGVNEEGNADALLGIDIPGIGRTVRIFSSAEEFDRYLRNVREVEMGYYSRMTAQELAPLLEEYDIPQVVLDRGSDEWWNRFYLSPHKA